MLFFFGKKGEIYFLEKKGFRKIFFLPFTHALRRLKELFENI